MSGVTPAKAMPSYGIQITPMQVQPAKPPMVPQEEYDKQLEDINFARFVMKCDAGRMWKWRLIVVEKIGEAQMGEFVESAMFDTDVTNGADLLREVISKAGKMVAKQAAGTISGPLANGNRIILPGGPN